MNATSTPVSTPVTIKKIYVLQNRWVLLGDQVPPAAGEPQTEVKLINASVIRLWGTTRGLGEIALNGPTPQTQLDPCGEVDIPLAVVLFSIRCIYETDGATPTD